MVTIYIVTTGEYSDYRIKGVFSTKKKAEAFEGKMEDESYLEEWKLDERVTDVVSAYWTCVLDIATGNMKPGNPGTFFAHPNARVDTVNYYNYSSTRNPKGHIIAKSFVSQEHADKLCVEKRQEIQRQGDYSHAHFESQEEREYRHQR